MSFILVCYLLPVNNTFAAIALDSTSNITSSGWYNCGTSCSWNHTVNGTNNILLVFLTSNAGDAVTNVTYNSIPLTQLVKKSRIDSSSVYSYIYYLIAPSTGTHTINVTLSSADSNFMGAGISYNGVMQSAPEALAATSSQSGTASIDVTTISNDAWVAGMFYNDSGATMSAGANTTFRAGALNTAISADTNAPQSFPGIHSLNISNTHIWIGVGAAIAPTTFISGSGTINRLAKFTASTTLGNSLFSDDGNNIILTAGSLLMQIGTMIDTVTNGTLNFGTTNATTLTFGRSGENAIFNGHVGIATSSPLATLEVNGSFFATSTKTGEFNTSSNCNSSTAPAVCGSAIAGSVALPNGTSVLTVNTTAVTSNSQIFITEDSSLGSKLGITCNTTTGRTYSINARTPGSSFTIKSSANPATNKACLSYFIIN